jgi:hypothetical protein
MSEIKFYETINRFPVEILLDLYCSIQNDKAISMPCFFNLPIGPNTRKSRNSYEHKIESSSITDGPTDKCTEKCAFVHIFLCKLKPWPYN